MLLFNMCSKNVFFKKMCLENTAIDKALGDIFKQRKGTERKGKERKGKEKEKEKERNKKWKGLL